MYLRSEKRLLLTGGRVIKRMKRMLINKNMVLHNETMPTKPRFKNKLKTLKSYSRHKRSI